MNNTYILYLQNQKNRLESRKRDLINFKFMGGGFGLLIFLFVSMGLGIIFWILAGFSNNNELRSIEFELTQINAQLATAYQEAKAMEVA